MNDTAPADPPDPEAINKRTRGYIPHWEQRGAAYFITFRLADSLPREVREAYEAERQTLLARIQAQGRQVTPGEKQRLEAFCRARIQRFLDTGAGACSLRNAVIAEYVAGALRFFDGTRYRLHAWCIMPNHVHILMEQLGDASLPDILHSWKSYTAHKAQKLLGSKGVFWEREYYDRLIRDERDFWQVVTYIVQNPMKANLEHWPWVEAPVLL
ncbi:MAG TPA: transposase [Ktedonobacterales bacterium]|jgi:REP element-mobilizing transposase RayT